MIRSAIHLGIAWTTILVAPALAQSPPPQFEHPHLMYRGPDPTSNYFWPGATDAVSGDATLTRLPPTNESNLGPAFQYSEAYDQLTQPPELDYFAVPGIASRPTEHKSGFFQKVSVSAAYIDRGGLDSFGVNEVDLSATFAIPAPTREWPMLITPAFNMRFLDGPQTPDLPARLYETYIDFLWIPRVSERWTGIFSVAPSLYTDFEADAEAAFRLTGKALVRYDCIPNRLQLVAGVLFLNRDDIRILPAGGLIWNPSDDQRYEIIFPRPKLAHRIAAFDGQEDWLYLGAEFGGNTFAIEQAGVPDNVTLLDYRVLVGLERKMNGGAGFRIEVGYVFARNASFSSGIPDVGADSTALVRGGFSY